jgi:hypothetical protein
MGLFSFIREVGTPQDMAKRQDIDVSNVEAHVKRLVDCGSSQPAFDAAFASLDADRRLNSAEIQAVAVGYAGGGKKPSNRKAALQAIAVRFRQIIAYHHKNAVATKARPL